MKKYIIEAIKIDDKFRVTFNTQHSFIKQYESLYANKMIIDGFDPFKHDIKELLDLCWDYEQLLLTIEDKVGLSCDEANQFLLKQLGL